MPEERRIIYWDACLFLDYIQGHPARIPILDALLEESASPKGSTATDVSQGSK